MSSNHRNEFINNVANSFLELLNPEKCLENGEFLMSLQNLYPSDYYKRIVDLIIQCESCQQCNLRGRKIHCSHTLCANHLSQFCPICHENLTEEDKSHLNQLFCMTCFQVQPRSNFIGTLCAHQCFNCINLQIGSEFNCKICMNRYDITLKTYINKCKYCDEDFPYCHMLILDCQHTYCFNCLKMIKKFMTCPKCKNSYFTDSQVMAINKFEKMFDFEDCNQTLDCLVKFCVACNLNYCLTCTNIHQLCYSFPKPLYS